MRARLLALLVVGLLLAPLPVLAAPDRSAHEEGAGLVEGIWFRFADTVSRVFGGSEGPNEGDHGPTIDPSGVAAPTPPPATATALTDRGRGR